MEIAMTELDVLEDLMDEDEFIRAYPSFYRYLAEWDQEAHISAPEEVLFEFYAEKIFVHEAIELWETYR